MAAWSKAVLVLMIGLIIWWGAAHWGELRGALVLFKQLTWRSLFLLFLLQFLYTLCLAASNLGLYHALGVATGLVEQTMLILTSGVANRLIPLGGVSGIGSFIYLAKGRGIPTSATVHMTAVSIVLGYLQTVPIALILLIGGQTEQRLSMGPSLTQINEVGLLMLAAAAATLIGVWIVSLPIVEAWLTKWNLRRT
ncbi:MAG: Phosphatidylglycerol lysyltransferase, partial [Bacilli bacterium]|nr:Phosphatidylglycerol lysyltransferase [Bacilli bacterium]